MDRDWTVHPGETLGELLHELGMSQAEFARRMGTSTKHVNQIIRGRQLYGARFALAMERVLGTDARFWMNLRTNYELDILRGRKEATGGQ